MAQLEAFFLPLAAGDRFCLLHRPGGTTRGAILFVHPFGEEMNKCRRMAALQARAFADAGWHVLQIDLYGCGDSAGDFGEATWARWVDDVIKGAAWMQSATGSAPMLWGARAGCLLIAQAAHRLQPIPDLVLWQPAPSGKQVLQQMLRLEVVGQMLEQSGGRRTGTQVLRERLAKGETIEVAGYSIGSDLARGLENAELDLALDARIAWVEIARETDGTLSPAARLRLEALRETQARIDARVVEGPAFWQTQEIEECPALIDETLAIVQGWPTR